MFEINFAKNENIEKNTGKRTAKQNKLSCCHWNVNSLTAHNMEKMSQTGTNNSTHNSDFICISETYFDS